MVEKIANWLTRKPKLVAFIAVLLLIPFRHRLYFHPHQL